MKLIPLATLLLCSLVIRSTHGALAALSIDLGSQYLKIALVKPGVPMEIVLNRESHRKTDAHVFVKNDERSFGDSAYNMRLRFPENSYGFLVDLLGKKFDHPSVHLFKNRFPYYKLVEDQNRGTVAFEAEDGTAYPVEQILGMIIADAQKQASEYAGQDVREAVITVPPFFNQAERRAMMEAAEIGGVDLIQLMNDNTAAALNYAITRYKTFNETSSKIIIYDMGATYTTASVIEYVVVQDKVTREKVPQLTILGVGYDRTLGGLEVTMRLRDKLAETFENQHKSLNLNLKRSPRSINKLFKEAERVKKVLSANAEHLAQIENFEDQDLRILVNRKELEDVVSDLTSRVAAPIEQALKMAEAKMDDIDHVVLMGGGTRFPKFQEALTEAVKEKELNKFINTDEAIAMGAVYQAAFRTKGFKVKKFAIRELNLYPIVVDFKKDPVSFEKSTDTNEETMETSTSEAAAPVIRRTLFGLKSYYPQKRKMTFSKHTHDFEFHVNYGDLDHLNQDQASHFGGLNVTRVFLKGVTEKMKTHMALEGSSYKGAKAHFRMDESGLLQLESADISFEKTGAAAEADKPSTFQKLGQKISNFFTGSGEAEKTAKDNGQKSEGKETESATEESTSKDQSESLDREKRSPVEETNATASAGNQTENATEPATPKPPKPVLKDLPLATDRFFMDISATTADHINAMKERLRKFDELEKERFALAKARNDLESFVIDMRYKVEDDPLYQRASKPEERQAIVEKCRELSDWIDEQGPDTTRKEFVAKLNEIKALTKDLLFKVKEIEDRGMAIETLTQMLNYSNIFLVGMKNFTGEDGIFTEVEMSTLGKLVTETQTWFDTIKADQAKIADSDPPKMTLQMLAEKYVALDREVKYLINKAKFAKPKPKTPPANETATNKTTAEEAQPVKPEETVKPEESAKVEPEEVPVAVEEPESKKEPVVEHAEL